MPKTRLTKKRYQELYPDALPEYGESTWQGMMHTWQCANPDDEINPDLPVERMKEALAERDRAEQEQGRLKENASKAIREADAHDNTLTQQCAPFDAACKDIARNVSLAGEAMSEAYVRMKNGAALPTAISDWVHFFSEWGLAYFNEHNIPLSVQRGFFNHYHQSLNFSVGMILAILNVPQGKEVEVSFIPSPKSSANFVAEGEQLFFDVRIHQLNLTLVGSDGHVLGEVVSFPNVEIHCRYRVTETGYELEYIESDTPLGGLLIDLMHQPTAQLSERVMAEEAFSRWSNAGRSEIQVIRYLRAAHGKPLSYEVLSEFASSELVSSEVSQYRKEHAKQHFFQSLWEQFRRFIGWPNRRDCILDQLPEVFLREVETGDSTAFSALRDEAQTHFASDTLLTGLFTSLSEACGVQGEQVRDDLNPTEAQATNTSTLLLELGATRENADVDSFPGPDDEYDEGIGFEGRESPMGMDSDPGSRFSLDDYSSDDADSALGSRVVDDDSLSKEFSQKPGEHGHEVPATSESPLATRPAPHC